MSPSQSRAALSQYMTPFWAAAELYARYFGNLGAGDTVVEPTCGNGSFLAAVPAHVDAVGVEIDPDLAAEARRVTGRPVIVGDFCTVTLDLRPTAVVGNPPFKIAVFNDLLARCFELLPQGGAAGFIVPAYFFQTTSQALRYAERWRVSADHLPRALFPRLSHPLVWAMFRKEAQHALVGFALYEEIRDVERMPAPYREALARPSCSAWFEAVAVAMVNLGGAATPATICRAIEGRRPTPNRWWKEKVRQILQQRFAPLGDGRWAFREAASQ